MTARFVDGQVSSLPRLLRWSMRLGLMLFLVLVRVRYGRGFHALPFETRRRIVAWWAFGPLGITRYLFKPVRATALLAYYEYASHRAHERAPA